MQNFVTLNSEEAGPVRGLKRFTWMPASLMLALAVVYLFHSVVHASQAVIPFQAGDPAVVVAHDPFVMDASKTGDGIVGCHFFCNGGCPIPPLADPPRLSPERLSPTFARTPSRTVRCVHPQPEKAPPRFLA